MKLLFKLFGYALGILFILIGVAGLITYEAGKLAGAFYILAGISILPPVVSKLKNKIKHTLVLSITSFLIFTVIGGMLSPLPEKPPLADKEESKGEVIQNIQTNVTDTAKPENLESPEPTLNTEINTPPANISTFNEDEALALVKKTIGNDSKTIEEIYTKETSIPAVTEFGWAVIKNPKGDGWYVGYKTELSGNVSIPIWWVKDTSTIYWVNGKAGSRSNKTLQQIPYNASGMGVSDIYTLMESQSFSE